MLVVRKSVDLVKIIKSSKNYYSIYNFKIKSLLFIKHAEFFMSSTRIFRCSFFLINILMLLSCGNLLNESVLENADQESDYVNGKIVFTELNRSFSSSSDIRIDNTGEKDIYVAGSVAGESAGDTENIWYAFIDSKGRVKNEALLMSGYNDRIRKTRTIDSDNIVIYADRYYDSGDIDFIIALVNRNTGIVWDYCFGNSMKNRVFDVVEAAGGGTIITGMTYYKELGVMIYITFIMKINDSGAVIWEKNYRSLFSVFMPSEIRRISDEEYLLSGLCLNRLTNKFRTFFARIGKNGDVISCRYINAAGTHTMLMGTVIDSGGGFTGVISLTGSVNSDGIVIASYDREMNFLSAREYFFTGLNVRGKLINGSAGSFIVAGMLNSEAGNGLYFLRFSGNGILMEMDTKYYDSDKYNISDIYFDTQELDDGLLYLCRYTGNTWSYDDGRLFLDRFNFSRSKNISTASESKGLTVSAINFETGSVELNPDGLSLEEKGSAELEFVLN